MTSSTIATTRSRFYFPWMFSRGYDLLFFFAPLAFALGLYFLVRNNLVASGLLLAIVVNAFGIGPLHQGPTWFFYLDRKNMDHWNAERTRQLIFFLGPVVVIALSVVGSIYCPGVNYAITTAWGIQHFVQQNYGILLLYGNQSKNEASVDKSLLFQSLWGAAIFFSAIFFYRLVLLSPGGWQYMLPLWILAILALIKGGQYCFMLYKQVHQGAQLNVPSFMFWLMSMLYFLPFAFLSTNSQTAFVIPGTLHWCQYIGLNYMLVKSKYVGERRKDLPTQLNPILLLFLFSGGFLAVWFGLEAFASNHIVEKVTMGLLTGMANCHYFQDAFLWRFREKYQRQSILPYLFASRQLATSPESAST